MRHPWQTWSVYVVCLVLGLGAMAWLTAKALELDEAEVGAREELDLARRKAEQLQRQAELEELVSSALWRMDTALAPLLAQEAARPYFVYQSFYTGPNERNSKGPLRAVASPLLVQPSPFVRLHFQVTQKGDVTSPQCASPAQEIMVKQSGVTPEQLAANRRLLEEFKSHLGERELLTSLPLETLQVPLQDLFTFNTLQPTNGSQQGGIAQVYRQAEQQGLEPSGAQAPGQAGAQPVGQNEGNRQTSAAYDVPGVNGNSNPMVRTENRAQQQAEIAPITPNPSGEDRPLQARANPPDRPQQLAIPAPGDSTPVASLPGDNDIRLNQSRTGGKWETRSRAYHNFAMQAYAQQRMNLNENYDAPLPAVQIVSEGVSRPVWIGGELLLARRVQVGQEVKVQGCWLDWKSLKQHLLDDVADLLPTAELEPVSDEAPRPLSRMLATLPVQLVLPEGTLAAGVGAVDLGAGGNWSPLKISLGIAWCSLLAAALAAAVLLMGVMALSERRAAFVAAVTHELRTPLTTFRMYAEMLADGMVTDGERKQSYLDTLKVEADRLYHLVENVLAYARLERSDLHARRQKVSVDQLLARIQPRLEDRCESAGMQLLVSAAGAADRIADTDPTAVEQILFNLVDNACKYAAAADDKRIHLELVESAGPVRLRVFDHGPGISADAAARLFQPFSKSVQEAAVTAPGVGLGLALSQRLAEELGGQLEWERGSGASFCLTLPATPAS